MEGRYSSTRRRLASLSSDHFLWLKTESRGPESGRWIALGCQHMRTTHLCLWRICLCEGRARIVLFPGFRSCGSTYRIHVCTVQSKPRISSKVQGMATKHTQSKP